MEFLFLLLLDVRGITVGLESVWCALGSIYHLLEGEAWSVAYHHLLAASRW